MNDCYVDINLQEKYVVKDHTNQAITKFLYKIDKNYKLII